MEKTEYLKELIDIEYDINQLHEFYLEIKHLFKNYKEIHPKNISKDAIHSPYFRCICKDCIKSNRTIDYGNHQFLRKLNKFKNKEIDLLTEQLSYITKSKFQNQPVMWKYDKGYYLPPHIDYARVCSIIVPVIPNNGGSVFFYKNDIPIIQNKKYKSIEHDDNFVLDKHTYSTKYPTAIYASKFIHGVQNLDDERVFINFSGYIDWDKI